MEPYGTANLNFFSLPPQQSRRWKACRALSDLLMFFANTGDYLPTRCHSLGKVNDHLWRDVYFLSSSCDVVDPMQALTCYEKRQGWEGRVRLGWDIFTRHDLMLEVATGSAERVLFLTCLCIRSQSFSWGSETFFLSSCWNTRLLADSERLISLRKASVSVWQYRTKLSFNSCN